MDLLIKNKPIKKLRIFLTSKGSINYHGSNAMGAKGNRQNSNTTIQQHLNLNRSYRFLLVSNFCVNINCVSLKLNISPKLIEFQSFCIKNYGFIPLSSKLKISSCYLLTIIRQQISVLGFLQLQMENSSFTQHQTAQQ